MLKVLIGLQTLQAAHNMLNMMLFIGKNWFVYRPNYQKAPKYLYKKNLRKKLLYRMIDI